MIITLVKPSIRPEKYLYRATGGFVRIQVGIVSENTNVVSTSVQRTWTLMDKNEVILQTGVVSVKINSFDSFVDLHNLPSQTNKEIYLFSIDDNIAVVLTIAADSSKITVIDETYQFSQAISIPAFTPNSPLKIYGNLRVFNERYVRLPIDWPIHTGTNISSGIVVDESTGKVYAFAPSRIVTDITTYPSTIQYVPFPDLPARTISIYVLPTIKKTAHKTYSITPSSRVKVSLFDKKMDEITSFETPSAVGQLEIAQEYFIIRIDPILPPL